MLRTLEGIQQAFNAPAGGKQVSLADLDRARRLRRRSSRRRKDAGARRRGPVHAGPHRRHRRSRPTSSRSPRSSRPPTGSATTSARATGCRPSTCSSTGRTCSTLSAPEMTVLVGGLRVLGANAGGSTLGVLTDDAGDADQRLLRQPARPGHDVDADRPTDGEDLRGPRPRHRRRSSGPAAASTSSSARTPSCGPSPRSTRATTRRRSSCATSSPPGTRS